MSARKEVEVEYIYTTVPAEYVCVYHRILAMLADYGEEMLKDCKASCTDRNSNVIECFNMFNAAVAARSLGKTKLAETLIKYIKAKINQIYRGVNNETSFVFPIDENGQLKAFVSCNDRPRFYIDVDDLYKQDQGLGFKEEYSIEDEMESADANRTDFNFECEASVVDGKLEVSLVHTVNGAVIPESDVVSEYYVNGEYIPDLDEYEVSAELTISLRVVSYYKGCIRTHNYVVEVI